MNIHNFAEIWSKKGPVMITGHTGFKGTWLTLLLRELGVEVIGYSLPPDKESIYSLIDLQGKLPEAFEDIRNEITLSKFIEFFQPSAIVHLAAQPLVIKSYEEPRLTFDVNVMGTVNLLELCNKSKKLEVVLVSTTDKVYKNTNSGKNFSECDPLEGIDPYSASKVAVESVIASWQNSYFKNNNIRLIAARAGNVIGGGDLSTDRLIPDCVRAHINDNRLIIRNPNSIRPWQHVLEPLVGYLLALGFGSHPAYNFGPSDNKSLNVFDVIKLLRDQINFEYEFSNSLTNLYESQILALDSRLAANVLDWKSVYSQSEAITKTAEWWRSFLNKENMITVTRDQIYNYISALK
jgi:CDP-glucose 4,6-dehydratase